MADGYTTSSRIEFWDIGIKLVGFKFLKQNINFAVSYLFDVNDSSMIHGDKSNCYLSSYVCTSSSPALLKKENIICKHSCDL